MNVGHIRMGAQFLGRNSTKSPMKVQCDSFRLVRTINVHVNESVTGTRFVHVRVQSNFSIHAVNEYEAGFGTHIRARTLSFSHVRQF